MNITDELRLAADTIEKIGRLHNYTRPETAEWSAKQLRAEANYLDKPVEDDSDNDSVPPNAEPADNPNVKTFAEKLDAAQSGEEFGAVLNQVFVAAFDKQVTE
jgi:hypothetical protein